MPSIGENSCDLLLGLPKDPLLSVVAKLRPGYAGVGTFVAGRVPGAFRLTAVRFATLSLVKDWIKDIQALQNGSSVTIVDGFGQSMTNCLILRAGETELTIQRVHMPDDPLRTHRASMSVEGLSQPVA